MPKVVKPYTQNQRDLALKRAQKFDKLFKSSVFDDLVDAAQDHKEADFKATCTKAGLVIEDTNWLWNYLQNCNEKFYTPAKEAAGTGW